MKTYISIILLVFVPIYIFAQVCPNVDYNIVANKQTITMSSEMASGGGSLPQLLDGSTANGYWNQRNNNVVGKEVFRFAFPSPTILLGVEMIGGRFLDGGVTVQVEGSNDGSTWTDVSGVITMNASSTSPMFGAPSNSYPFPFTGNTSSYVFYRIYGLSGQTDWNWIDECYFSTAPRSGQSSNSICNDNNTVTNTTDDFILFDLSPVGTGMYSVAVTSGLYTVMPATANFGTTTSFILSSGSAGKGNVEITIFDQTENCGFTEIITDPGSCGDSDADGLLDVVDIDDDNDGIKDAIESPSCFFTKGDFPYETGNRISLITVTTDWTFSQGALSNLLNGNNTSNNTSNSVRKTNGDFTFSGQEFLHFTLQDAVTFDKIIFHHEGAVFLDVELIGVVQGSNDNSTWIDLTLAGVVLPDGNSPHTLNLTQNLANYTYYRVFVNSGRIDDDEYLREIEFSMIFEPSLNPKPTCSEDLDGDMVFNHLDIDSDGDGCSDALEHGSTSDTTTNFAFPTTGVGTNGLHNSLETVPDNGVINYTVLDFAYDSSLNLCADSDDDGVGDLVDLDADNDGILDADECIPFQVVYTINSSLSSNNNVVYEGNVLGNIETVVVTAPGSHPGLLGPNGTIEGNQASISTNGNVGLHDRSTTESVLVFTSSINIRKIAFTNIDGFDRVGGNGSGPKDALAFDQAGTWVVTNGANLASYNVNTGALVTNNPGNNAFNPISTDNSSPHEFVSKGALSDVLFRGTGGTTNNADVEFTAERKFMEIALLYEDLSDNGGREFVSSSFALNSFVIEFDGCNETDTDNDLIPDFLDLDSDNDNCPDAMEGGGTLTVSDLGPNGKILGAVSVQGIPILVGAGQSNTPEVRDDQVSIACPPATESDLGVTISPPTLTGNEGERISYTVTLTNAGPSAAENVEVEVNIPVSMEVLLFNSSSGSYNTTTQLWSLDNVPVGTQSLTITYIVL